MTGACVLLNTYWTNNYETEFKLMYTNHEIEDNSPQ